MSISGTIATAVGLALAHFTFQAMTGQDWSVAAERTWYTTTACLAMFCFAK